MTQMPPTYDVIIIGAGIIGCLAARELTRYKLRVAVLERANDIGEGASKATSGVVYTSLHKRAKSLKAISCLEGNKMYDQLAAELDIPFKRVGSLFCAFKEKELEKLAEKYQVAQKRGHLGVRLLSPKQAIQDFEPRLNPELLQALYLPQTGIVDPFQLVLASAQSAQQNGADFFFNATATSIEPDYDPPHDYTIKTGTAGNFRTRFVLNAAGDRAAHFDLLYHSNTPRICPLRGQYLVFDKQPSVQTAVQTAAQTAQIAAQIALGSQTATQTAAQDPNRAQHPNRRSAPKPSLSPITHVLHQAGESDRGGILLAPTVAGNLLAGPVSNTVYSFEETATSAANQERIKKAVRTYIQDFDFNTAITGFAGNRANFENVEFEQKDFLVRPCTPRFVSILGINTPGMTAAPYLAKLAVEVLAQEGLELQPNPAFNPQHTSYKAFINCDAQQQSQMLKQNSGYVHIICRCENITGADVQATLQQPLPPKTLDGFKKRLRIGMGRCHGAHCTARLLQYLNQRHLLPAERLVKNRPDSNLVMGYLK